MLNIVALWLAAIPFQLDGHAAAAVDPRTTLATARLTARGTSVEDLAFLEREIRVRNERIALLEQRSELAQQTLLEVRELRNEVLLPQASIQRSLPLHEAALNALQLGDELFATGVAGRHPLLGIVYSAAKDVGVFVTSEEPGTNMLETATEARLDEVAEQAKREGSLPQFRRAHHGAALLSDIQQLGSDMQRAWSIGDALERYQVESGDIETTLDRQAASIEKIETSATSFQSELIREYHELNILSLRQEFLEKGWDPATLELEQELGAPSGGEVEYSKELDEASRRAALELRAHGPAFDDERSVDAQVDAFWNEVLADSAGDVRPFDELEFVPPNEEAIARLDQLWGTSAETNWDVDVLVAEHLARNALLDEGADEALEGFIAALGMDDDDGESTVVEHALEDNLKVLEEIEARHSARVRNLERRIAEDDEFRAFQGEVLQRAQREVHEHFERLGEQRRRAEQAVRESLSQRTAQRAGSYGASGSHGGSMRDLYLAAAREQRKAAEAHPDPATREEYLRAARENEEMARRLQ